MSNRGKTHNIVTRTITASQAKGFLLRYQYLDNAKHLRGDEGIIEYIKRVGCIQFDPLNIVGRNADLVLQSRIKGYKATDLESLLYDKRTLIDGWDKMMSIYLTEDWPNFCRVREAMKRQIQETLTYRNSMEAIDLVPDILKLIEEKGPLQAKDVNMGTKKAQLWGHKKMSSATLDYMYHIGMIGVASKKNTQKRYDLIERLIPKEILDRDDPFENDEEFDTWYIKRRMASIGLLWAKSGGGWLGYHLSDIPRRKALIKRMEQSGQIIPVHVDTLKEPLYLRQEDLDMFDDFLSESGMISEQVRILAPLDNLLWDRDLIEKLFGFKYTWEVYVPEVKRKYGYYVLPVLYKQRFIGRFEPDLYKPGEILKIKRWWWEENIEQTAKIRDAIRDELRGFCEYLGASDFHLPTDF